MATFATTFLSFAGLALLVSAPVLIIARRNRETRTARRFLIAGGVLALVCAVISTGSERLVRQCEDAGNTACSDIGATGMQFLLVAGYAVVSWTAAFTASRR